MVGYVYPELQGGGPFMSSSPFLNSVREFILT